MHDVTFPQETKRKEELLCVRADGTNVQSNIFAETFNYVAQVHTNDGDISTTSGEIKDRNDLSDSKTKHRWPRCSKVRSRRTTCFLSSGSDCLSLFKICTSFCPALYLNSSEHIRKG